ncbi:PREDICTED: katanin p80 WD40 repeat-containing subunit B1-like [Amphimedon queenslandica]|uniref:Katanin p80 WD40 repeat-containing subunit B1 n=1 Tax=Amphimedon queenslandica TaxID=400682 RepID=A0A1X7VEB1_AMPQE|nr:PREDICTED: katanin p80 WD40 repeat-containing subunit B1-like [Amphimedon queenslandica]|eukprot:XP_019849309.1 PREDICTED: katanin p80 WD40 repeat-containing subunit B1-like [Amphimedon queenslandica]
MASNAKSNWKISEFVAHGSDVLCACLSPFTGRTLATGGEDKRVNLWLVGQPQNISSISGLSSPIECITFNGSESWLGAGSRSGSLKVFDLNENKVVRSISGHKSSISCLDFHRYGDILASGSMDTNIKLWDVRRKGCLYTYKGHSDVINGIQFSPDGKWLVSASSDNAVRLWDLNAGKCLKEFSTHSLPVNDIQFHPKELLLAAASSDRTISYWDLETLSLISTSPPEGFGIRKILFHSEANVIFSASQDCLRVHSWEPSLQLDYLSIPWGKTASMQLSGDQIVGVSYSSTMVSLWCIDFKKLKPWSHSEKKRDYQSVRQKFQYREEEIERPLTQPTGPPQEEEEEREVGECDESPPKELQSEDRQMLFKAREQLVRTPPKGKNFLPFQPPLVQTPPPEPRPHIPSFDINKPHPQDSYYGGPELERDINEAHSDVCSMLRNRLKLLQEVRSEWSLSEPKGALEVAVNSGDQSVIIDLLSILNLKRSLWSLDMAVLILPELRLLLKSKHERYLSCATFAIKLILKSFASVIISNIRHQTTPTAGQGIDLAREERLERCQISYSHLCQIREDLATPSPLLSRVVKESGLMETFSLLD